MPLIKFENVTKKYQDDIVALDEISFEINPKEFVFLVGPSGAGKSTLVKLLIKEEDPTSGDILFNDESILEIEKDQISDLRRRIGVVFQDFKLLETKTVFENVAVALEVVDSPQKDIKEIVPSVLSLVGLEDKADYYPSQLSGGEKQRIALARAIAHEPDVIVADEPTGMIDPDSSEDLMEVFEKVNTLGTTILMATHDREIVNKMKKRVLRIEDGKITSDKMEGNYDE